MKRSKASQRRKNRDYWDRKKKSKAQEKHLPKENGLTQASSLPQQGLRLPSAQGKLLLMEAPDGTLVDVPEEKVDDWLRMQGQEAVSQEQTEAENTVLDMVLEMLYGKQE